MLNVRSSIALAGLLACACNGPSPFRAGGPGPNPNPGPNPGPAPTAPAEIVFGAPLDVAQAEDYALVVTDFNGDGKLDVIGSGESTTLHAGHGDGTFESGAGFLGAATWLAAGDFNRDGHVDLLEVGSIGAAGNMLAFTGRGDGTFLQPPSQFNTANPYAVVMGDFNGDGADDAAIANALFSGTGTISVLPAGGQQTQEIGVPVPVGPIATADLNGDGKLDLVAGGGDDQHGVAYVYFGTGSARFLDGPTLQTVDSIVGLAIADANGDGKLDLVLATRGGSVAVAHGDGAGGFILGLSSSLATQPNDALCDLAVADFNGDGKPDVAALFSPGSGVSYVNVAAGYGDGTFAAAKSAGSVNYGAQPGSHALGTGDFNGDGKIDLVWANVDIRLLVNLSP